MDAVTTDLGPFAMVPSWLYDSGLSARAIALYGLLGQYAERGNQECYPSRATLARRSGCSLPTLDRTLRELSDAGVVQITARFGDSGQSTNLYRLRLFPVATPHPLITHDDPPVIKPDDPPVITGDERTRTSLEPEPRSTPPKYEVLSPPRPEPQKRRPDPVWDSLVAVFGEPATTTERKRYGKVRAELVGAGATAEQIMQRSAEAVRRWEGHEFGLEALCKHWTSLGRTEVHQPRRKPGPGERTMMNLLGGSTHGRNDRLGTAFDDHGRVWTGVGDAGCAALPARPAEDVAGPGGGRFRE